MELIEEKKINCTKSDFVCISTRKTKKNAAHAKLVFFIFYTYTKKENKKILREKTAKANLLNSRKREKKTNIRKCQIFFILSLRQIRIVSVDLLKLQKYFVLESKQNN